MSDFFRRTVMCLTGMSIVLYLVFRAGWTLNLSGPFAVLFSIVLYASELYGAGLLLLYFFNIWEVREPAPVPPLPNRTVDVLIPTYNEDPHLLRGTICAALAIEYPHRTYVLDDSRRPDVKQLVEELGAHYICRETNLHAKAGNLNHALDRTDGEFVVIFDADQLSSPTFITRLIGYFADERLAFVQTPHAFYNFDNFQARLSYKHSRYWDEGELFYNLVQPGKNRWNAVVFCGSAAMFRRAALQEVGLIATETITEDLHTGLRLHAKGWKSLFINERLICALAATDVTTLHTQRLRWGEGNLGVFFYDNPCTMRGLTLAQRLSYVGSMLSWTTGLQKLILYVTPAIMLLTAVAPVKELTLPLAVMTIFYLASIWMGVKLVGYGHGRLIAEEFFHMTCFWTNCRAMYRAVVNRQKARFIVTNKRGRQSRKMWQYIAPQILYITLAIAAITWASARYYLGLTHDRVGLVVGASLLTVHALFAWAAVCRGLRSPDRRFSWRHPCAAHVRYELAMPAGDLSGQAVTMDLNERGVSLIAFQQLPLSKSMRLKISAGGTTAEACGRILKEQSLVKGPAGAHGTALAYRYDLQFHDQTSEQLAALWSIGGGYAVTRQYERFNARRERARGDDVGRDRTARDARLPVTFAPDDEQHGVDCSVTEWISVNSFVCLLPRRLGDEARRQFRIDTPFGSASGAAVVGLVAEQVIEGRPLYLHRFDVRQFEGQSRGIIHSLLQTSKLPATRAVIAPIPFVQRSPILKPLVATLFLGSFLAAGVIFASLIIFRDEITLVQVARGESSAPGDVAVLEHFADLLAAGKIADRETKTLVLAGLHRLHRDDKLNAIWESPAANLSMTPAERLSRAQIRAGAGHYPAAEEDFHLLLEHAGEPDPAGLAPELLGDLYLSAARNSYNAGDIPTAAVRYEMAFESRPGDVQVAVEYAGVLITRDRVDEAIAVLKSVPLDGKGRRLLAAAYMRERKYAAAIAIEQELLRHDPENASLQRDLADSTALSGDYKAAAALFEKLLERTPRDRELRNRLAQVWLEARQYDRALETVRSLVDERASEPQLQQEFLDAAASAPRLTALDRQITQRIFDDNKRNLARRKPEFVARLTDVLARLNDVERLIPMLQRQVESEPESRELRRRLADTLAHAGKYEDAEFHYRLLLAHRRGGVRHGPR